MIPDRRRRQRCQPFAAGAARHGESNGIFRSCRGSGNRQGGESGEIFRANSAGVAESCGDSESGWCGDVQGTGGGVQVSDHFRAILGCLLSETWTTPTLVELVSTTDGHLLGRCAGEAASRVFLGNSEDLLRNIHGLAIVAELDGDEIGYLLGRVAKIGRG